MAAKQAKRRSLEKGVRPGALRALDIPAANEPIPVLRPAPPIPVLAPADPLQGSNHHAIRGLWLRVAIGVSFWLAFGVLIWASLS